MKSLTKEEIIRLKSVMSDEEWVRLVKDTNEAWKNRCCEKIVGAPNPSKEDLELSSMELRYGAKSLLWFFENFLVELTKSVDNDKE